MVSWINQTGLQASAHGIDWNVVNAEVDAGRPVLLSSRSHWYAITGRNEQGQYYTGATGAVVGNGEWTRPGEFVYAGARPDTMVLTHGKDVRTDAPIVQQYNLKPRTGDPGLNRAMLSRQTQLSAVPGTPQPAAPGRAQTMSNTESLENLQAPPMFSQAQPRAGLVAGQAEPVDQMARVWQQAYKNTGDRGFADGLSALLIGEGGMRGGVGDNGQSYGVYQFYWGGGEGNGFESWLRQNKGFTGSRSEAQQLAKDVDLATEYYLPRVKSFYDAGTAQGHQNPVQAIAVGGHNRGAPRDPRVWNHYAEAWENWKRGNPEQQNTVQTTSAKLMSTTEPPPPVDIPWDNRMPWEEPSLTQPLPRPDSGGYTLPQETVTEPPLNIFPPGVPPGPNPNTQVPSDEMVRAPLRTRGEERYAYQGHRNGGLQFYSDMQPVIQAPDSNQGEAPGTPWRNQNVPPPPPQEQLAQDEVGVFRTLAANAEQENPWNPDPQAQANRHQGMRLFHQMPPQERDLIFANSLERALEAEGIPPEQREHWRQNMTKIVKGTPQFPGENPTLNPFAMAGENRGTPLYASDPRDKSPMSNELNSSALGYYQFIIHDPRDPNKDPYGHKQFLPPDGNFYDPVTQHRMFIRAVRNSQKHGGDPASVTAEKARTKVWGP
jgi:hypothetical protein